MAGCEESLSVLRRDDATMSDAPVIPRSVSKTDIAELEDRVSRLERVTGQLQRRQRENMPLFKKALIRLDELGSRSHDHANALQRLEALGATAVKSQTETAEALRVLVGVVKGSKTATGLLRRYWPRIFTCVVGIAIGKGWLTAEDGKSITGLIGL